MHLTLEASESNVLTIEEVIKELRLTRMCVNPCKGDPTTFTYKDDNGEFTFDLTSGEIKYKDEENAEFDYNYYERELGCDSLAEALDTPVLVWCKNDRGETVAYIED